MAKSKGQGWHGNPTGHARAGRLGGLKSAERRRQARQQQFAEKISTKSSQASGG